ncbi:MAG: hypothetical protein JXB39_05065 [Deltaproteobacteria bacterium]|nr:hypothetical protein [Deltaproteobacteria bacterium]
MHAAALLLGMLPAHAILPGEEALFPPVPQPIQVFDARRQVDFRMGAPWRAFLQTEGAGWRAVFDETTGLPFRAWGPGIALGSTRSAHEVESALRAFFARHPALTGVDAGSLNLASAGYLERRDTWYVSFEETIAGVPVVGGGVDARIVGGRLVFLRVKTHPGLGSLPRALLDEPRALREAVGRGPAPWVVHKPLGSRLVLLPRDEGPAVALDLAWEVRTETQVPRGRWLSYVDAHDGTLLGLRNEIPHSTGRVLATHDTRAPDGHMTTSGLPWAPVSTPTSATYTDADGYFDLVGDTFTSSLVGEHVRVSNRSGAEGSLTFTGSEGTWTSAAASQAEIDVFVFVEHVRTWAAGWAPEVSYTDSRITANVNDTSFTCNAYYDGSLNFAIHGSGCNNTARIADVVYHEWCHGFHYYSLVSGTFDYSASEGIADSCSVLLTDDSVIAPYFYQGYASGIRDLAPNRVYPDDLTGESHNDGLIFGGTVWDLLQILEEEIGDEEANDVVSDIFVDAIKAGFTIPESYDEFVLADDDDGDLSNGTPHICEIVEAFTLHGIGPMGGLSALVVFDHEPIENQTANGRPIPVHGTVLPISDVCGSAEVAEAWVVWSTDGGETWEQTDLEVYPGLDGDEVAGTLPAQSEGTTVLYYVEAETTEGVSVSAPIGADISPFAFYVGDLETLYFEDFEADDGGYTSTALEGRDDWEWGAPQGIGGDPREAYSGSNVWGNDLSQDGAYANDCFPVLTSVAIPVAPFPDLVVQFRRYLGVEDGYYDDATLDVDGETVWRNHATNRTVGDEHHQDDQWTLASVRVTDADLDGFITLAWGLEADPGLTLNGWTLDDVTVYAPASTPNRLAVTDFQASEGVPGLRLSWTNPDLDDLDRVVVVFRDDRYPTHPEDGTLIWEELDAAPGEAIARYAPVEDLDTHWFAVFAVDAAGTWSQGVYPGYNADQGTAGPGDPEDTGDDESQEDAPTECGCGASPRPASAGWLVALGLGLAWRRRRR